MFPDRDVLGQGDNVGRFTFGVAGERNIDPGQFLPGEAGNITKGFIYAGADIPPCLFGFGYQAVLNRHVLRLSVSSASDDPTLIGGNI